METVGEGPAILTVNALIPPDGRGRGRPGQTYKWVCPEHGKSFATFATNSEAYDALEEHLRRHNDQNNG